MASSQGGELRPLKTQPPTVSRRRLLPLAMIVAVSAAALSGSCTSFADETGGASAVLMAVVISGVIALGISLAFILLNPDHRGAKLVAMISAASYLAAGFGAWFLLVWPFVVAIGIAIGGGLLAHPMSRTGSGDGRGYGVTAGVSGVAIVIAATVVVVGFWMNYDLNIGWFGDGGGGPDSLNVSPFALICGGVPPIVAVIAARLTAGQGAWGRDPPEQYESAFPGHSQPSVTTLAILVAVVGLFAAGADYLSWASHFGRLTGSYDLANTLLPGCFALAVAVLFVMVTPDRREAWLLALISGFAYAAGVVASVHYLPGAWQTVAGLAVVFIGGGAVANTVRRKFGFVGQTVRIASVISALGIFLAAVCVAGGAYGWISFRPSPLFLGAVPIIIAATTAHLAGRVIRRSA